MYHALVENALQFLSTFKRDSNKTRDLYKRLELALRADGPRLTAMRRTTPLEFAVWIKQVEDFARARAGPKRSIRFTDTQSCANRKNPRKKTTNPKRLRHRRVTMNHDYPNTPVNACRLPVTCKHGCGRSGII